MAEITFDLRFDGRTLPVRVEVPGGPARPVDLLPVLHEINGKLIEAAAGDRQVSCQAGCGACCRQIVPISETEARYLADLVAALPDERRRRVIARFGEVLRALAESGMLARLGSEQADWHQLGLDYFRLGIACPFLEDESCSIHPHRPASCREYLVTSPAANCASPTADNIAMVELPAKMSRVLNRFSDGRGDAPARWMALPLLLEWVAEHCKDPQPVLPGAELLRNFMNRLVGRV